MKLIRRFQDYIWRIVFSDELAFNARMVNMVSMVGAMTLILATVTRMLMGASAAVNSIMFSFCFIALFFVYLTNKYRLYNNVIIWSLLVVICDILLPVSFFLIGGASSGIAAFVVMAATCILLLTDGKTRIVLVTTNLLLMAGCFIFAVYHPEWVEQVNFGRPLQVAIDNIQCFTISTIFVGLAIVFQRYMYSQEQRKVERAKAAIEQERQVSLALFEANPHINILFDDKFQVVDFNPAALKFAEGLATEKELRENLPEILARVTPVVQPDGRPSADLATWLHKAASEGEVSFETTLNLCGNEHNTSVVMKRIPYADSFAIVAYLIDNSEMHRMRTEALISARAKSDFLANMSHEIRTPLNAVISMTHIGKTSPDVDRKDYAFEQIGGAADHLLGIINDILDMSKIDANKLELNKAAFNVEEMLRRAANVISFKTSEKHQQFSVSIAEAVPVGIITDDLRLTQIITNLLSNAVKFTPEGGLIELSAELVEQKGRLCTLGFSVSDTGIGIPSENIERIFHSFEQVETNTARKFGGTGLGLAISKRFVELLGGELSVVSEPGKGSTFSFTIRTERTEDVPRMVLDPIIDPAKLRFLIVSSEKMPLRHSNELLKRLGITSALAHSRNEAWEMLEGRHYDVCVLGGQIDGIESIDLAYLIREKAAAERVIMSLYPYEVANMEAHELAKVTDGYLTKPLFLSDCVAMLNRLFGEVREEEKDEPEGEIDFSGVRLLLAEDLEVNKEIVLALLEPLGFEIDWAKNGLEALDKYESDPGRYHLILMDMQMPEMDGLEATRRIRALADSRAQQVPIIALTANVFREDVESSLAAGMNDHIGKPLDYDELISKLSHYLNRK
ncbi:MAG: response regulator [Coriobacteriales bacterium]|jgi:signal transduction histidine kinase/CheY-like chemotaxis protein|nr:response regulator [Coriobacteriales bacterium]